MLLGCTGSVLPCRLPCKEREPVPFVGCPGCPGCPGDPDLGGREDILLLSSAETWNIFFHYIKCWRRQNKSRLQNVRCCVHALGQLDAEGRARPQQDGLLPLPALDSDLLDLSGGRQNRVCSLAFDFAWVLCFHRNRVNEDRWRRILGTQE